MATIMLVKPPNDGGLYTNIKGRLNFGTLGSGPSDIITLSDSNFAKTLGSMGFRPTKDSNDAFIGYDQGAPNVGISFGAPYSLTNYIGNVGDGLSWKERLTSTLKTFNTDVQINGKLILNGKVLSAPTSGLVSPSTSGSTRSSMANGINDVAPPVALPAARTTEHTQQLTYTVAVGDGESMSPAKRIPWVYINRSTRFVIKEVYCEVDAGTTSINFRRPQSSMLDKDLSCNSSGSSASTVAGDNSEVAIGGRLEQITASSLGAHRLTVVLTYTFE
jgi:hypothetical protein